MPPMRVLRFVVAAGVLALASRVSGESLGEAAAKEQARREAARRKDGPAVVVHEEDLKNATGRIANDPSIAPAAKLPSLETPVTGGALVYAGRAFGSGVTARGLAPAPGATDANRVREDFWRQDARRRRVAAASAEQVLKDVERWSDPTYAGKDRPSCPITRSSDRRKARADAARARQALQSLDEEARVGGALPGWIRE
jgi:hypothetical protein